MIVEYIGLAEKVKKGYTVFFPDFPGCGSAGNTLTAARNNAREGLLGHIELMIEANQLVPGTSTLDHVIQLSEAKGCIPLIIPIVFPSGKAERINITMDSVLLEALDSVANSQHKTRSGLLSEAVQKLLGSL